MTANRDQNSARKGRRPGQPELVWPDKMPPAETLARALSRPADRITREGLLPGNSDAEPSVLIRGENGAVLRALAASHAETLDFIYADPPFATGTARAVELTVAGEKVQRPGYADPAGNLGGYIANLQERLVLMRELLAPGGTLCLHVDQRLHPYARLLLDEVFGPHRLVNDIVWSYRSGGGSRRRFGMKHDNLLLYAKTADYYFDPDAARVPYDAIIAPKRSHLFHEEGKVGGDVWDINRPPNHGSELTGYPTQKPLELLERLLAVMTPAGGTVADFFAGSGTLGIAAQRLGRRFLIADASPTAGIFMLKRLAVEARAALDAGRRARDVRLERLASEPAPANHGGNPDLCLLPLDTAEIAIELLSYRPVLEGLSPADRPIAERHAARDGASDGLDLVDLWGVDFTSGGDPETPFRYDWLDYRLPRKRSFATASIPAHPPGGSQKVRVRVVDVFGRVTDRILARGQ